MESKESSPYLRAIDCGSERIVISPPFSSHCYDAQAGQKEKDHETVIGSADMWFSWGNHGSS